MDVPLGKQFYFLFFFQLYIALEMGGGGVFLRGAFLKGPKGAFFRRGVFKVGRKYRRTQKGDAQYIFLLSQSLAPELHFGHFFPLNYSL